MRLLRGNVFTLGQRILLRKRETSSAIIAMGLLTAAIVPMYSVMNYISEESSSLSKLARVGETYLVLSSNSTSVTDSKLNPTLLVKLSAVPEIEHIFPQKVLDAKLNTFSVFKVRLRAVGNLSGFLHWKNARIDGFIADGPGRANLGAIIARLTKVDKNDRVELKISELTFQVEVVGVFETTTELDSEVIIPLESLRDSLTGETSLSLIEFTLKGSVSANEVLNRLTKILPRNATIIKVQQLNAFLEGVNIQTLILINIWASIVYTIVALASCVVVTRVTLESIYEFSVLRALGANREGILVQILAYTMIVATLGSLIGIALGIVGVQTISTILRWIRPHVNINLFLRPEQALQTLLLTLISSFIGSLYPAHRATYKVYVEQLPQI
ncbi:MAG: FtsX-like permease family protein [Candidatus Korarchaeum sp.]